MIMEESEQCMEVGTTVIHLSLGLLYITMVHNLKNIENRETAKGQLIYTKQLLIQWFIKVTSTVTLLLRFLYHGSSANVYRTLQMLHVNLVQFIFLQRYMSCLHHTILKLFCEWLENNGVKFAIFIRWYYLVVFHKSFLLLMDM